LPAFKHFFQNLTLKFLKIQGNINQQNSEIDYLVLFAEKYGKGQTVWAESLITLPILLETIDKELKKENKYFYYQFKILSNIGGLFVINDFIDEKDDMKGITLVYELYEIYQTVKKGDKIDIKNESIKDLDEGIKFLKELRKLFIYKHEKNINSYIKNEDENSFSSQIRQGWGMKHRLNEFFFGLENVKQKHPKLLFNFFDCCKFIKIK